MSGDLNARKGIVLALIGTARAVPGADLAALDDADWAAIDAMAAQHRLQPWLHDRLRRAGADWPVPGAIAANWKNAYRAAALTALTAQAALIRLSAAFAEAEVPMVALKGARLAFFAYSEAALRPMRDVDLLVAPELLSAALDAMAQAGCTIPADRDSAIARALDGDKHLDPVALPACDRFVELHHRITEPGLPGLPTEAILAEARADTLGGVQLHFPSAEHMLAHLVLHAVYNHRFDCGPVAIIDIAMLARQERIDANRFAAMARVGGWLPGARLILALTERHMGPTGLDIGQDAVPAAVLAECESLILQDFDQRAQVKLASEGARAGMAATLLSRLRRGLARPSDEGRLRWLASRAARTIRQGSDARARSEAAAGAAMARWLDGS